MKTKYPSAVSLTKQQIEWIRKQPNGSEIIGKIIDAFMGVDRVTPEAFRSIQVHLTIELLNQKISDASAKRRELLRLNSWNFRRVERSDGIHTDFYIDNPDDPTPINEDGQIVKRVLADYDESIKQMQSEIQKLRTELLQLTKEPSEKI